MSPGVPARIRPWISSSVEKVPEAGLAQVGFLSASLIRALTLTLLSAVSLSLAMLVRGMTPAVIICLPAFLESSRTYSMHFLKVARVIRAGIQPSPYSTARRQEAGVPPPTQIGMRVAGVGLSSTSSKLKVWSLYETFSPAHSLRQMSVLIL